MISQQLFSIYKKIFEV